MLGIRMFLRKDLDISSLTGCLLSSVPSDWGMYIDILREERNIELGSWLRPRYHNTQEALEE